VANSFVHAVLSCFTILWCLFFWIYWSVSLVTECQTADYNWHRMNASVILDWSNTGIADSNPFRGMDIAYIHIFRCSSRSSVSEEHLMGLSMFLCESRFSRGSSSCMTVGQWSYGVLNAQHRGPLFLQGYLTCMAGGVHTGVLNLHDRGLLFLQGNSPAWPGRYYCKNDLRSNNDLGSHHCTTTYVVWREEHLWNVSLLQRVHHSNSFSNCVALCR
jgi:hypothetical protein